MIKKQKISIGSILEINIENKYYVYAQILKKANYAFFDYQSSKPLTDFSILNSKKVLFIVAVYKNVVTQGKWLNVGKLELRKELEILPPKFIQDAQNPEKFELYDTNTGTITPTTKDRIIGLERAAVWEAHHIEDRIKCHYKGEISIWIKDDTELFK